MNNITNENIILEVCSNTEWLRENGGLDLEKIPDGFEDESANELARTLHILLAIGGYETESATGQRILYHGWNGENRFAYKYRAIGTFNQLTEPQKDEIERIYDECVKSVMCDYSTNQPE